MEVYILMWVVYHQNHLSIVLNKLIQMIKLKKAYKYRIFTEEKRKLIKMLRKKNYEKLASFPNITIYTGQAKFINSLQIEVKNANIHL